MGLRHRKPTAAQLFGGLLPGFQQCIAGLGKIRLVPDGSRPRRLRQRIYVVRAVAELDAVHIRDQLRAGDAVAQPRPCEIVRFRKGMRDHKVFVALQQRQAACARRGKLYVGFVHHHDVVRVCLQNFLNFRHRQQQPGGGVGVGDHHRFPQPAVGGSI